MCKAQNDREILSVLQEPLSLESEPFTIYAKRLGIEVEQVLSIIKNYINSGLIRRIAGIIKHDRAGYLYNAMIAFEIEDELCDKAGEILSRFSCISHCYRRTTYPDWPYNLYAMVHAQNESEFEQKLIEIKNSLSFKSILILPTIKEFKKTRYRMSVTNL